MLRIYQNSTLIIIFMIIVVAILEPINDLTFQANTASPTNNSLTQTASAGSVTPSQATTPQATATITPSPTLMPLPAITLIFPVSTASPTQFINQSTQESSQSTNIDKNIETRKLPPRVKALTFLLVVLWLLLAIFLIIYLRQFR